MRVFVVSEDATERRRATTALQRRPDVEIEEATSAREAHRRLAEGGIDVLVIDGDLRPEGGFSVLYELRAQGDLRGEPTPRAIVLLARPQDRFLADWARADVAVMKPVDPFEIAGHVSALAPDEPAPPGLGLTQDDRPR